MSEQDKDRIAKDIENLVELFNQSEWDEMHLKTDDLEVFLSNDPNAVSPSAVQTTAPAPTAAVTSASVASEPTNSAPAAQAGDSSKVTAVVVPEGMIGITAPNLGTFYRAPKPGAAPYVEVGQNIEANTDVCLIEVMKLFTPVKAGHAGKVHEVCVEDGVMIEFGQLLVIVDPR